ncbi:MAG: thiamine diphosphokinase [Candidatus Ornithospirochaeta sp.]
MEGNNIRCVVVGGGEISTYSRIKKLLRDDDYFIFCDSGLRHEEDLGVVGDLVVGDFDSYPNPMREGRTVVLPERKDDTDTMYGVKYGLSLGFRSFLLLGMTGRRLDHTLSNIYALDYLSSHGAEGKVVDDWSEIEVVGREWTLVSDAFPFFSLIAWKGRAEGVYIENAEYPLSGKTIDPSWQYGVSNESLNGGARVRVEKGSLLLIKDWDRDK